MIDDGGARIKDQKSKVLEKARGMESSAYMEGLVFVIRKYLCFVNRKKLEYVA